MKKIKIGIIGCGGIGRKRAVSLPLGSQVVAFADINLARAHSLAEDFSAVAFEDWTRVAEIDEIEAIIVSTLHQSLVEIAIGAIKSGKHVFLEKPAARNVAELDTLIATAKVHKKIVRVGFNHRYHRSLRKAREIVDSGALGELMFIRGRYGHGARVGYEKEWRADPHLSGGGELIDQGPHLIDLSSWFLGEFSEITGHAQNYFWDMPVDDNAFMLLKTPDGKTASLQVSCTEWKNLFSFEIYGKLGKLDLSGLGGSYGVEKITWYKMLPEMGPPETTTWEYPMPDNSWHLEISEFVEDIREGRDPNVGLREARAALSVVEKIYRDSGYDHNS